MLCVGLNLACSSKIVISAIYRPPDSTPSYDFHSFTEFTSHLNNPARFLKSHSLILGDFNYPAIKWIEGCGFSNSTNSADSAFCETLQDHSLLQVNPFSDPQGEYSGLIITGASDRIMNIATMIPIQAGLETDRDVLEFDFVTRPCRVKKPARYAYNFKFLSAAGGIFILFIMFNVYIVNLIWSLALYGASVCCVSHTFVPRFRVLFKCIFSLVFFSIVIMVKAIK